MEIVVFMYLIFSIVPCIMASYSSAFAAHRKDSFSIAQLKKRLFDIPLKKIFPIYSVIYILVFLLMGGKIKK